MYAVHYGHSELVVLPVPVEHLHVYLNCRLQLPTLYIALATLKKLDVNYFAVDIVFFEHQLVQFVLNSLRFLLLLGRESFELFQRLVRDVQWI